MSDEQGPTTQQRLEERIKALEGLVAPGAPPLNVQGPAKALLLADGKPLGEELTPEETKRRDAFNRDFERRYKETGRRGGEKR